MKMLTKNASKNRKRRMQQKDRQSLPRASILNTKKIPLEVLRQKIASKS